MINRIKTFAPSIAGFVVLVGLTFAYLYPGSLALVEGRTDLVMSDGTDPAALPYAYDQLQQVWKKNPANFFYGTVYSESGDPERGSAFWMPWNERWIALLASYIFPIEQVSTAFIFCLFLFNFGAMYALGRYLRWPWVVSAALAIAWAFNCYTRARAKVHGALVGTYHLPLIFLGLFLVARGKGKGSIAVAALCFLFAGTVAHYYLATCVFISPLFLAFLFLQPESRKQTKKILLRFVTAIVPLILFLGFNFVFSIPPGAKITDSESKNSEWIQGQEDPFLDIFYAHPIDYLAGDIALEQPISDINPLRKWVGENILSSLGRSNSHERTNGIRWSILILAGIAFYYLVSGKLKKDSQTKWTLAFLFVFALFCMWLSSSPDFPTYRSGASYWLYSVFYKLRVASRAGIMVHFSLLLIVGIFLASQAKQLRRLLVPGVLLSVMVLDYFPLQRIPTSPILPAYQSLNRSHGDCGPGMIFPYITAFYTPGLSYYFSQRLRGSDCVPLNSFTNIKRVQHMLNLFPPVPDFIQRLPSLPQVQTNIEKLAECVPLNWIAFDQSVPAGFASEICRKLNWDLNPDGTCIAKNRSRPLVNYPDKCL